MLAEKRGEAAERRMREERRAREARERLEREQEAAERRAEMNRDRRAAAMAHAGGDCVAGLGDSPQVRKPTRRLVSEQSSALAHGWLAPVPGVRVRGGVGWDQW